jgi:hypothetical protein
MSFQMYRSIALILGPGESKHMFRLCGYLSGYKTLMTVFRVWFRCLSFAQLLQGVKIWQCERDYFY